MLCYICNRQMTEEEIIYDNILGFEPCGTCLSIAMDAAYGKTRPDDDLDFIVLDSDFDDYDLQYELLFDNEDESYV